MEARKLATSLEHKTEPFLQELLVEIGFSSKYSIQQLWQIGITQKAENKKVLFANINWNRC